MRGVGGGGRGASPPGSPLAGPSSPSTASLSGAARCWHSNAYFSFFFAIFLRPTEQICPDSAGPFIVSILLALLFSLFTLLGVSSHNGGFVADIEFLGGAAGRFSLRQERQGLQFTRREIGERVRPQPGA